MLIDLNIPEYNDYLEFKGNSILLTDDHYNLMAQYDYLIFKNNFNQSISRCPPNIKVIVIMSDNFNQPLNNLPNDLEALQISRSHQSLLVIEGLPDGLTTLNLTGSHFQINELPASIKYLRIAGTHIDCNLNDLPKGLEYLQLSYELITNTITLPPNLKELHISYLTNRHIRDNNNLNIIHHEGDVNETLCVRITTIGKYIDKIVELVSSISEISSSQIIIELYDYDYEQKNNPRITENPYISKYRVIGVDKNKETHWTRVFKYFGSSDY